MPGRVLFIGVEDPAATSRHRADAFRRLGFDVTHIDIEAALARQLQGNFGRLHYHSGYRFLRGTTARSISSLLAEGATYDVCWVDSGDFLDERSLNLLKARCKKIILFNHDDPTGSRDWRRFATLRSAIPRYDLCVVVREFNVKEFLALGARQAVHVYRTYDEVAHAPPIDPNSIPEHYRSDVSFIGVNYKGEGRDRFLAEMIQSGIGVAIWGNSWRRSRFWPVLENHVRGGNLAGKDYVAAIRGAKLCLGLLASRNRDEHTTRSMEIPYAGGVLCAQRTGEHQALYAEGVEAVFWDDVKECISVCSKLLADESLRENLRTAGMKRVRENGVGNENLVRNILNRI